MSGLISSAVFEGAQSLHRAKKHGDISLLIERLRSDSELLREEREFLADIIEKKRRMPASRPPTYATELRDDEMIETFLIEKAVGISAKAAERVASRFGMGSRQLHRIHADMKHQPKRYENLCKRVTRQVDDYLRLVAHCERDRQETVQRRWDERRARRLKSLNHGQVT